MSQEQNLLPIRSRFFCVSIFLAVFVSFINQTTVEAQVPTQNHQLSFEDSIPEPEKTVVKSIPAENPIPLGVSPRANLKTVLNMKGYDQEFIRSFTFKNTSDITYTISSIDFVKKDHNFELFSIQGNELPLEVAAGETFSLRIAFHAFDRNQLCTNELRFTTDRHKEPVSFFIQAIQQPLSEMPWNKKNSNSSTVTDSKVN